MKLRTAFYLFGSILAAAVTATVVYSGFNVSRVRIGGPLYGQIIQGKDLVADILPPPAYIIESYLEATLALNGAKPASESRKRLEQLRKDYEDRHKFWTASDLEPDIKEKLTVQSEKHVARFWSAVEDGLLPALEAGDRDVAARHYHDVNESYLAHREVIDAIVKDAEALNKRVEGEATSLGAFTFWSILAAVAGLFAILAGGLALTGRTVLQPILALTRAMQQLANGDFAVVLPGLGRKDEIGDIAAAVELFKVKSAQKAQAEAEERAEADRRAAVEKNERERRAAAEQAERDRTALEERAERERQASAERDAATTRVMSEFDAAVGGIVASALAGDFSQRVPLEGKTGVMLNLASGLNALCDNISAVLGDLGQMLAAMAKGDLTRRIATDYQGALGALKSDANATAVRLSATISDIKATVSEVTGAASEIAAGATDLSQRTEEQAAGLEQTSGSMRSIATTVNKNAENARQASRTASGARDMADRGGQIVAGAVAAMARIQDSSGKIADIIGVIDEIARQTNLLALNAAVEAARAGDAGRGFAVVASEVRTLAQRSSQAAKDIKDLITRSNSEVEQGVGLVNKAGESLGEIVQSISEVATAVSDIAAASGEQAVGVEQINRALAQMDEATQQNSALVEESAATAKTLEGQALAMSAQVDAFHVGEPGQRERRAA
ncbi:MAG: methyl-accepting chemotaxis protein [Beijerinckiaceae bacterium]